ncbi:MAG: adenylyltransferase/cytidyltransferase family protein [Candidatus Nanohaloarchaea archaeon]
MKAGFLGRFQPLHLGHREVIEEFEKEFDDFSVLIGSPEKSRTERNPLTFEERKSLIKACFPDIDVLPVEDTDESPEDTEWEDDVNKLWAGKFEEEGFEIIISGNELVREIIENHTSIQVRRPEMHNESIYSGTEVRRRINSGEEWRYLTPKCSHEKLENFLERIKKSGTQYEFEPGWKKENSFHSTAEK